MHRAIWAVKRTAYAPPSGDPVITQPLRHMRRSLRPGNTEIGSFHLTCSDPNFNFRPSQVIWTKYELITRAPDEIRPYGGICCDINPTKMIFLGNHFPPRVIKYYHSECSNPLAVVFKKCSMLIFVKIRYENIIPSASHVDIWNFTMNLLYHHKLSITIFDMFRTINNPKKIKMLGSDMPPDVNSKSILISEALKWHDK